MELSGKAGRLKGTEMLVGPERIKTLKLEISTTLLQAGFSPATITKKNNTAGRKWSEARNGFTYREIEGENWADGSMTLARIRIRRWAKTDVWSDVRQLNPNAYKACLDAAGFITEVKGKDLFVLGKES